MEDLGNKVNGNTLDASEWNQLADETINVILGLGILLSSGDLNQLGKAIAGYVANGNFYTDSGAADAYTLTQIGIKQTPTAYTDGMEITFVPDNTNTGASTVNVAALGVKNIKLRDATDPAAGDIKSGETIHMRYDVISGNFIIDLLVPATNTEALAKALKTKAITPANLAALGASTTFAGLAERATQAETETGTDDVRFVTPKTLTDRINNDTFTSAGQTITSSGNLTIAHGLGVIPSGVTYKLVCQTAEFGYAIGDELFNENEHHSTTASNHGMSVVIDSTNIKVEYGSAGSVFVAIRRDTNTATGLTNGNWELVFVARK